MTMPSTPPIPPFADASDFRRKRRWNPPRRDVAGLERSGLRPRSETRGQGC